MVCQWYAELASQRWVTQKTRWCRRGQCKPREHSPSHEKSQISTSWEEPQGRDEVCGRHPGGPGKIIRVNVDHPSALCTQWQ
jgi:hypothetical protein